MAPYYDQPGSGRPHFSRPQMARATPGVSLPVDDAEADQIDCAAARSRAWLISRQNTDGHWCAELEGDSILQSEYILLLAWMGREESEDAQAAARRLLATQLPDGGWAMYPGGELEISGSVKAYFALKLCGYDAASEPLVRARAAILEAGGADAVNSFTRFYLALLGQIPYEICPAVPPEICLLPTWSPFNIYRMSAWSRTIIIPLSIMWASKPTREVPTERGIRELFIRQPADWPALRCPGLETEKGWFRWETFFRRIDATFKTLEHWNVRPLRKRAIETAKKWMLDRFENSDGLGAIFPPIIWSIIALKSLGYADDSPEVQYNFDQLAALMLRDGDQLRLQPCLSPVWDTAIAIRAVAAGDESSVSPKVAKSLSQAIDWLLDREITVKGDWSQRVNVAPGGWCFEYRNSFYPDIDDTIMVLMALRESGGESLNQYASQPGKSLPAATDQAGNLSEGRRLGVRLTRTIAAVERAKAWTLALQNRDGGWGAFDKDNDAEWLCRVPFADHNAMIDPSTPDITARVLEALAGWGIKRGHSAVERALAYLRSTQEEDGAWYGRWGVNYIYGTWQTLVGLAATGVSCDDPTMVRGARWFLKYQQPSGGWGESADTYEWPQLRGQGTATASQTAWALLGLVAAGCARSEAVVRGVRWLVNQQQPDGSWDETEFTGTGFPRVFYLRYHYYPQYFPLLAIEAVRKAWTKP
jgi:squalene-hopene/tetraprenyl-beta-curcumene cyclase